MSTEEFPEWVFTLGHINNGKTEAKGTGVPGLSAGSFMIVSWTILFISTIIGICIAIKLFPNEFKSGELNGVGTTTTILVTAAVGQLLFWWIWKKGWKSNAKP
jgi:uncharacterized membrane protein AbrB (regulator of aidB expression)